MPMPIQLAHRLTQRLAEIRKSKKVDFLRPDGNPSQHEYRNGRPARVDTVVISTHTMRSSNKDLHDAVMDHVIRPIVPARCSIAYQIHIIDGRFVIGGPWAMRRDRAQNYCGQLRRLQPSRWRRIFRQGSSKVDRSACYMARYIAKNIVSAGLARKAEVQLAYAIGVAEPFRYGRCVWHREYRKSASPR